MAPSDPWTISRGALESLLVRLAEGGASGAVQYEVVRRKLIRFLELRGAAWPESAADEALDRVARKVEAGEPIQNLRAYIFGVARHVLLEGARRDRRERLAHDAWAGTGEPDGAAEAERRLQCLEGCLRELPAESRALVEGYHARAGTREDREALARRFGLTPGALRTRMHRLRNELASCLERCLQKADGSR
jgi:DNA-directed RNA polymerase specialized sigma24 family protein